MGALSRQWQMVCFCYLLTVAVRKQQVLQIICTVGKGRGGRVGATVNPSFSAGSSALAAG